MKLPTFGLQKASRMKLFRSMVQDLIRAERVITTKAKGKVLQRLGDKVIGLGKRGTTHGLTKVQWWMRDEELTRKVCQDLAVRYLEQSRGYTRCVRIPNQLNNNSEMSLVELTHNGFPSIYPAKGKGEHPPERPKRRKPGGLQRKMWVRVEHPESGDVDIEKLKAGLPSEDTPV